MAFKYGYAVLQVLAAMRQHRNAEASTVAEFPEDFFFGAATAPAQAEDQLDDQWLAFGRAGRVHMWKDIPRHEERSGFWSNPEAEIELAKKAQISVFRMGIDWTRTFPSPGNFNATAMARYVEIVSKVRAAGFKVMMTLFHHSMPGWAHDIGGWTSEAILPHFAAFTTRVVEAVGTMVDYWLTFNEPHVFVGFVHCTKMWPPGDEEPTMHSQVRCMLPHGDYDTAMWHIAEAHNAFAQKLRQNTTLTGQIGVAHNVANVVPYALWDQPGVALLNGKTRFPFMDAIQDNMDFIGLNYYGREIISGSTPVITEEWEYSESGRCIDPNGMYTVLKLFWDRYHEKAGSLIITENGISDGTDILRPSYIIEHLMAVRRLLDDGVKVAGYVSWTSSDNWEWVDGYCPKFGLAAVDRSKPELPRVPRPSLDLFAAIAREKRITSDQRDAAWKVITDAVERNATRTFCRSLDGISALDAPIQRNLSARDWRFTDPYLAVASMTDTAEIVV